MAKVEITGSISSSYKSNTSTVHAVKPVSEDHSWDHQKWSSGIGGRLINHLYITSAN